jgi:hypothetical protein
LEVVAAPRKLIESARVVVDPAVEAGLAVFEKGGDFADGVIASLHFADNTIGPGEFPLDVRLARRTSNAQLALY